MHSVQEKAEIVLLHACGLNQRPTSHLQLRSSGFLWRLLCTIPAHLPLKTLK